MLRLYLVRQSTSKLEETLAVLFRELRVHLGQPMPALWPAVER